MNLTSKSVVLPVVPMFHVNAWGVPYAASMLGCKLVFPGPFTDGESIYNLINDEGVNNLLGVPTVWLGLLNYLDEKDITLKNVNSVLVGGSAAPKSMIKDFQEKHNVFLLHGWGMTEMSPLGTLNQDTAEMDLMELDAVSYTHLTLPTSSWV